MKKNFIIFIFFTVGLFSLLLFSCKKDPKDLKGPNTKPYIVKGIIKHIYTGEPISGIHVRVTEYIPHFASGNTGDTLTGKNGEFEIHVIPGFFDTLFKVAVIRPNSSSFDTTNNQWKFLNAGSPFYDFMFADKLTVEMLKTGNYHIEGKLFPAGQINAKISDSTWQNIGADTIIFKSAYDTITYIKNKLNFRFLSVNASEYHQFNWFYIKNGIKSTPITKDIFVPNAFQTGGQWILPLEYKITF